MSNENEQVGDQQLKIQVHVDRYLHYSNLSATWLLEAVKHISIINVAGIAAVAALHASGKTDKTFSLVSFENLTSSSQLFYVSSAIGFLISSLFCIIAMLIAYGSYRLAMLKQRERLNSWVIPQEEKIEEVQHQPWLFSFLQKNLPSVLNWTGGGFGYSAFACTLVGSIFFVWAVMV